MALVQQDLARFEGMTAEEVLAWALGEFFPSIAVVSSFSAEDVAVIHIAVNCNEDVRVVTLDTGRLPQETYEVIEQIRKRYGVKVECFFPDTGAVEAMVQEQGPNLFYDGIEQRKLCCRVRKVEPLERAIGKMSAWVTGLRRAQSVTRTSLAKVEIEEAHGGRVKINPLADWTTGQVWDYVKANAIPYNKLHDQGYPSIGCAPCTRAIAPGEDERAGRWWWENPESKECGLHVRPHPAGASAGATKRP